MGNNDDVIFAVLIIAVLSACFIGGCHNGNSWGKESQYRKCVDEAVRYGHAEYYLDEKNEKQWRWKEIK